MQHELTQPGPLLDPTGRLAQVGWSRHPLLDCNLEDAAFYPRWLHPLQALRVKRWDYYALFTPRRFFSATIANLGYAANVFVYTLDWQTHELHEEGLVLPARAVTLPRNSETGEACFANARVQMSFTTAPGARRVQVDWPGFQGGRGIQADFTLACPPAHESMNIVIPIRGNRFYLNRKINCLPASGVLTCGGETETLEPASTLGALDWGRGVWEYRSYWNWASASGFLPDGRPVGLNLGRGFGDLSRAGENALVLDGRIHKLGGVAFDYDSTHFDHPWRFRDEAGRLDLIFTPFKVRVARSNLFIIFSEVHQVFGHYSGTVTTDSGEAIPIDGLTGFAEEHHARW